MCKKGGPVSYSRYGLKSGLVKFGFSLADCDYSPYRNAKKHKLNKSSTLIATEGVFFSKILILPDH